MLFTKSYAPLALPEAWRRALAPLPSGTLLDCELVNKVDGFQRIRSRVAADWRSPHASRSLSCLL